MPKKSAKTTKAATKKKATTKRPVEKKVKAKTKSKKKEEIDPNNFLHKENESQLKSLITKEFDKELTEKSAAYIKSFVKIEDSIISVNDFLNYVENLDEDLFKLFKAYTNSSDNDISSSSDDSDEEEKSTGVKSDDPVRMYLKEMGNVELLSRIGEIEIAKRIEVGKKKTSDAFSKSIISMMSIQKYLEDYIAGERQIRDFIDLDATFRAVNGEQEDFEEDISIKEGQIYDSENTEEQGDQEPSTHTFTKATCNIFREQFEF